MSHNALSPRSLVATTEGIRGLLFQPDKRAPLVEAGFEWAAFEQRHLDLEEAGVGFRRASYPILLDAEAANVAGSVLDGLRSDLSRLRELAPKVFTRPDQIDELIACTVPDGTQHFELADVDPADVYVIALQDMPLDLVAPELPRISKMRNARALYIFGIGLRDADLSVVDFSSLSDLRALALSGNELLRFPEVTMLEHLVSLNLMNNPMLWHMPSNLAAMTGLRRLDLRHTGVAEAGNHQEVRSALPACQVLL